MKSFILLFGFAVALSGCSSQSSSSKTKFSSVLPGSIATPPTSNNPAGPVATLVDYGGTVSPQAGNIHFRVKTILNAFGQVDPSNVRVRFSNVPTDFTRTDGSVLIDFYLMGVSPTGSPVYPSTPWTPARVRFENPATGQALCPTAGTSSCFFGWDPQANNGQGQNYPINQTALASIATASGLQPNLLNYNIIVSGAQQIYQLLRVVVTSSAGTQYADVLIPRYEANPNVYRDTRHSALHAFHPLWSEQGLGLTSEQYRQRINGLFTF